MYGAIPASKGVGQVRAEVGHFNFDTIFTLFDTDNFDLSEKWPAWFQLRWAGIGRAFDCVPLLFIAMGVGAKKLLVKDGIGFQRGGYTGEW